jgi:hypothetical protein
VRHSLSSGSLLIASRLTAVLALDSRVTLMHTWVVLFLHRLGLAPAQVRSVWSSQDDCALVVYSATYQLQLDSEGRAPEAGALRVDEQLR